MQKKLGKALTNKYDAISSLRDDSQSLIMKIKKIKNEKKMQHGKLEQLINKFSLIDKETMTSLVEVGISS